MRQGPDYSMRIVEHDRAPAVYIPFEIAHEFDAETKSVNWHDNGDGSFTLTLHDL